MDKKFWVLYIACIIMTTIGTLLIFNTPWLSDEYHHKQQINYFQAGNFVVAPSLTVIPGYHIIMFTFITILNVQPEDIGAMRMIGAILLTLLTIPIIYGITKNIKKTLQIYLFPTFFSFYFILYTDMMSLAFVLLAWYLFIKDKPTLSGIAALIAITIRQNNLVWLGMMMIIPLIQLYPIIQRQWKPYNKQKINETMNNLVKYYIKKYWMYIIDCILFLAFVIYNGGIIIYDRAYHPLAPHVTNIWFALFTMFFLFLPLILYKAKEIIEYVKKPEGAGIAILLTLIIIGTYSNTHWYNLLTNVGFVKNTILQWGDLNYLTKFLYAIPCVITALWLCITKIKNKMAYTILFFSVFVLIDWMVDMRYFMIPVAFFLIYREEQNQKEENIYFIYMVMISLILLLAVIRHTIFW